MSRIYFHTRDEGDAEVRGSERAHMGIVVADVALAFAPSLERAIEPFIKPGHYLHGMVNQPRFMEAFRTTMRVGDVDLLMYQGSPVASFDLQLNTALATGNDPLCLMAKLHAQCEIHAWVEGTNRAWLAGIIEQGQKIGLYRANAGWDEVVKLLRLSDSAPVVTSYSVCDSFPSRYVANWAAPVGEDGEPDEDAWYELSDEERWDLAMAGLRQSGDVPALRPEGLRHLFGQGLTILDIFGQSS